MFYAYYMFNVCSLHSDVYYTTLFDSSFSDLTDLTHLIYSF